MLLRISRNRKHSRHAKEPRKPGAKGMAFERLAEAYLRSAGCVEYSEESGTRRKSVFCALFRWMGQDFSSLRRFVMKFTNIFSFVFLIFHNFYKIKALL